jgi:hypothetical protein
VCRQCRRQEPFWLPYRYPSKEQHRLRRSFLSADDSLASYPKVRQMTHFGSYKKRDLQGSIRRNIYAWMAPEKMSHRLISRFLRIDQNPHECSFVKKRPVQEDNTFIDKRRKLQPKFLFWGVQLLLAVGFNVAKRYVKSWTASLAKEETPLRRTVSELRISGETKSKTIIGPLRGCNKENGGRLKHPSRLRRVY